MTEPLLGFMLVNKVCQLINHSKTSSKAQFTNLDTSVLHLAIFRTNSLELTPDWIHYKLVVCLREKQIFFFESLNKTNCFPREARLYLF